MNCPKCQAVMEAVAIDGIEIDRCSRCKGIWFDLDEEEQLRQARGGHQADIGHQAIGEYYNAMEPVLCPVCQVEMDRKRVKKKVLVEYEVCPHCRGAYFDAGEFREFAEPATVEFFVDLSQRIKNRFWRSR